MFAGRTAFRRLLILATLADWGMRSGLALANDWGMGAANDKIPPNNIFTPVADPANQISSLAFFVLGVTGAIFLVVGGLLLYSIMRFRARADDQGREPAQIYGSTPIEFAWTTVPILIVFALILTTVRTIYDVQAAPKPDGAINVRVIGHQWWWEFQYPDFNITTANELHIPLSDPRNPTPTFLQLVSVDVAHSFWVPRLAGKTDLIPNKLNTMWIDPHQSGTFLGQCAEFCGTEHALMMFRVVVESRERWNRWIAAQREAATQDPSTMRGRQVFESNACINCHTIRGTIARGKFGPDLTHLMSRETIAAGVATNNLQHLKVWLKDPDDMKPGALMPAMNLGDQDVDALVAYLATLR